MRFFTFLVVLVWGLILKITPGLAQVIQYLPQLQGQQVLPASAAYIKHVVDARPQSQVLGYTKAGGPLAQPVMFQQTVTELLPAFFARYAPGQPQAVPVVMRLTELTITELRVNGAALVSASMRAEFYAAQADSNYYLVAAFAKTQQQPITGGASAALVSHSANVSALLLSAATLAATPATWAVDGLRYPAAHVFAVGAQAKETLPILLPNVALKPGFYHTLAEFSANNPSEPGMPEVESRPYLGTEWAGDYEIKPYHHNSTGQRALATDTWGFCDGQSAYIRRGLGFYKLQRQADNFSFFAPTGTGAVLHTAINLVALATLASGAGGVISTNPEHRGLYYLDLTTGQVSLSQSMGTPPLLTADRPTQLFVYRPRNAKGPAARIRLGVGQPVRELAVGDYLDLVPLPGQPLQISFLPATGPEVSLAVMPTSEAPIYLECRPAESVPLRQVSTAAGAAALTKLVK